MIRLTITIPDQPNLEPDTYGLARVLAHLLTLFGFKGRLDIPPGPFGASVDGARTLALTHEITIDVRVERGPN